MDFLNDFLAINKVIIKKTAKSYIKHLKVIPLFGLYMMAFYLVSGVLGLTIGQIGRPGGFVGGILSWIFQSMILSDFINHVDKIVSGHKTTYKDIGKYYLTHFSQMLSATAIPNIIVYLIYTLSVRTIIIPSWLIFLMYTCIATPEVIYQKNADRLDIFVYGFNFFKENIFNWLVVNGIFIIAFMGYFWFVQIPTLNFLTGLLISTSTIMNYFVALVIYPAVGWTILGVLLLFVLVYRGYLFKVLSVSSRRKREYMRNIYGN